jgi:peroxiredoxin
MQANVADSDSSITHANKNNGLRRVIWAMTVILGISLATNLYLAYKVRKANQLFAVGGGPPSLPPSLPIGASLQPLKVKNLEGQDQVISFADSKVPVVLYVFTPECGWCARNLENLRTLLTQKQGSYRFVGLSISRNDVKDYVAETKLDLPIFLGLSEEVMKEYKLGGTPQTIVVSPEGKVMQNWVGAYVGSNQTEVEKFFAIQLPGVTNAK